MKGRKQRNARRWIGAALAMAIGLTAMAAFAGTSGLLPLSVKSSQGNCAVGSSGLIECQLGDLPYGANAQIQVAYAPPTAGQLINTAVVGGNEPDPFKDNNKAVEGTTVLGLTDLSITKTDDPDPVFVGKTLTYKLKVVNNGPSVATGVTVVDDLPPSVTPLTVSSNGGNCAQTSGGDVTCYLGSLVPGAEVCITITVTPNQAGTIVNTATVTGNERDPNPGNNKAKEPTTVKASPKDPAVDLSITKTDNPDPVYVGGTVTYTITVTNNGPDAATGVIVTDNAYLKDY